TGSTAYSMAAGGPILTPSVDAFVVTPVSPHSLTHRVLVVRDTSEVTIVVKTGTEQAYLSIDGQVGTPALDDDRVICRKSEHKVRLFRVRKTFFEVLRTKLKWGQVQRGSGESRARRPSNPEIPKLQIRRAPGSQARLRGLGMTIDAAGCCPVPSELQAASLFRTLRIYWMMSLVQRALWWFVAVVVLSLSAIAQSKPAADLIITNAKVWTVDPGNPTAQAIAVLRDRIVAVGSNGEIETWRGAATKVVD